MYLYLYACTILRVSSRLHNNVQRVLGTCTIVPGKQVQVLVRILLPYKYWRTVVFVDERTAKHRRDVLDVMGTKNEMSRTYSSYKSYKYFTQEHILLAWQSEL